MKNDIGKMIRRVLLVLLVLLAIACRLAAGALAGSAWDWYAAWRGLPLEAVGSQAESDDPRARSIADMEEMDLFAVEQVQEWDEAEYFHLIRTRPTWQSDAYCVLTLESGARVAARCSTEGSV